MSGSGKFHQVPGQNIITGQAPNRIWLVGAGLAVLVVAAPVHAEDGEENWDGEIELAAASASGNSENTTIGLAAKAKRSIGRFINTLTASANFAEADGAETQNNFIIAYQLDAELTDRAYAYGRTSYEEDQFSGFDRRIFLGAGVGYYLLDADTRSWKVEAGPGYRLSKIERPVPLPADFDDEESELAVYAASEIDLTLREGVILEHDINSTWTSSNTTVSTVAGLTTTLTDSLSSKISYQVDYETDPPAGREDTDTLLKASILFGF